jgi:hypothetical protein
LPKLDLLRDVDLAGGSDETALVMFGILESLAATLCSTLKNRRDLALENLALRQQVAILRRQVRRPTLTLADRLFWVGAHENLGWVEGLADLGSARNGHPLVPGGIQAVLDSPVATPRGSPGH